MVLNNRLTAWYTPSQEQSGAQKGRSCEEQILVVRLLIDIARKLGLTLFIGGMDYQKAYDTVSRNKLLTMLRDAGCGKRFLSAIASSLSCTLSRIGSREFQSTRGVRQGGPTSCGLFTFYVDCLIKAINNYGPDDWLKISCLMQMDDTLVFAASRRSFIDKLMIGKSCSDILDQSMHPVKSKFFTVNSEENQPIMLDNVMISYQAIYVYLGTLLFNASISTQAQEHIKSKNGSKLKFYSFLNKNRNAPFCVKEKVWSSALTSSIYYSCETWLGCDKRILGAPYLQTLKSLIGVRQTTCTDLVYTEAGVQSATSYVLSRQASFIKRLYTRPEFENTYIGWAVKEAIKVKSPMGKAIMKIMYDQLPVDTHTANIALADTTRRKTYYQTMNPTLSRHIIYSSPSVPEYARISVSRLRLSSHHLRIETGRWARIERNRRVCRCHDISPQDEEHVLFKCPITAPVRTVFPQFANLDNCVDLFEQEDLISVAHFCHKSLQKIYES